MYHREHGDDILKKDERLKHHWVWSRIASGYTKEQLKKWTHFQVSGSRVYDWTLSAIQWGSGEKVRYEARIEYIGNHIACSRGGDYKTRIEAQIAAEKLLYDWIKSEYLKIVI